MPEYRELGAIGGTSPWEVLGDLSPIPQGQFRITDSRLAACADQAHDPPATLFEATTLTSPGGVLGRSPSQREPIVM
jgi:hypothetical protein